MPLVFLSGHFSQETENLAAAGSGFSLLMTSHWRKVFPPLIGPLEVVFPSLDLSLKPEGGFYHWLNVGHRRKEREEVSGRQKQ